MSLFSNIKGDGTLRTALDIFHEKVEKFKDPLYFMNATFLGDDLLTATRLGKAMMELEETHKIEITKMVKYQSLYAFIFRHFCKLHDASQPSCSHKVCKLKASRKSNEGGYNLGISGNLVLPPKCFDSVPQHLLSEYFRYSDKVYKVTESQRTLKVAYKKCLRTTALFHEMEQFIKCEAWLKSINGMFIRIKKLHHDETKSYVVPGGTTEEERTELRENFASYWLREASTLNFIELAVARVDE